MDDEILEGGGSITGEVDGPIEESAPEIESAGEAPAGRVLSASDKTPVAAAEVAPADNDVAKLIEDELERDYGWSAKPKPAVDDLDKLPEGIKDGTSPAQRYQALANRTREAEAQARQYETGLTTLQQQAAQQRQWFEHQIAQRESAYHEIQTKHAALEAKLEAFMQFGPGRQEESEAQKYERQLLEKFNSAIEGKLSPLQQQLEQERAQREQYTQQVERERLRDHYLTSAQDAAAKVALRGFPEEMVQTMAPRLIGTIMATALHLGLKDSPEGTAIEKAAQIVRQTHMMFGLGLVKSKAKDLRSSLEKGRTQVPVRASTTAQRGQGESVPDYETASKHGYKDELEAMLHMR
jgi:hypothetical protein